MPRLIYLSALLFAVWLTSCTFHEPQIVAIRNFEAVNYRPLKDQLIIRYEPVIHNPNDIDLWVDVINTKVYFDGQYIGTAKSDKHIDLPSKRDTSFTLTQNVHVTKLLKKIKSVFKKDSIPVLLDSEFTVRTMDYEVTLPFSKTIYVNPKKEFRSLKFPW